MQQAWTPDEINAQRLAPRAKFRDGLYRDLGVEMRDHALLVRRFLGLAELPDEKFP